MLGDRLLALALLVWSCAAQATPVSVALEGSTDAGLPMRGVVTYDDSLDGPCRYLSCFATGPGLIDLTIGGSRYRYADPTNRSSVQNSEDRTYARLGVYGGPALGQIAELTFIQPGPYTADPVGPGRWSLNVGAVQYSGPLASVTPIPLRLPVVAPAPAGIALALLALILGAATSRAADRSSKRGMRSSC